MVIAAFIAVQNEVVLVFPLLVKGEIVFAFGGEADIHFSCYFEAFLVYLRRF